MQELWDADISDGGIAMVQGQLAMARRRCNGTAPAPDLALWVAGAYAPETPIVVVAVEATGLAAAFLVFEGTISGCPVQLLCKLLSLIRAEDLPEGPPPAHETAADRFSVFAAEACQAFLAISERHHALKQHLRSMKGLLDSALETQRSLLLSEATERRRAAVNAKKQELDVARARIDGLQRQVTDLQGQLRMSESPHD